MISSTNSSLNASIHNLKKEDDPLIIPSSVEFIGINIFPYSISNVSNLDLKFIKYTGEHLDKFSSNWYNSSNTTLITG